MKQVRAKKRHRNRVLIGIPMTGQLRSEWHLSYVALATPCNWSAAYSVRPLDHTSPMDFLVAEARNIVADQAVRGGFEWLFFIDHDVCLPYNTLQILNKYMKDGNIPIFGGLYFTRSVPSEPLTYRGPGNSFYSKWKMGDKVWLDGMGLGCTVLSVKLLKAVWEDSEEYQIEPGVRPRRIFETPSTSFIDPETGAIRKISGTEDLAFYKRVKEGGYYAKAGYPKIQKRKYPILCDTSLFCTHICMSGIRYPSAGEEKEYMPKK
jgi:hypothetical protein